VSLVILKALFDAILADGGCLVESNDQCYKTSSFRMGMVLDDERVRTLRLHVFSAEAVSKRRSFCNRVAVVALQGCVSSA
jgi:hypothetical protein